MARAKKPGKKQNAPFPAAPGPAGSGATEWSVEGFLHERRREIFVCLLLVLLVLLAYRAVLENDFINLDDPLYVTGNPQVNSGLSAENLRWAFTTFHAGYWHPLTWLSLQLDAEIYGHDPLNAAGFHLTSMAFHAVNAVLLFLVLYRMTGALWRSGLAAALFAVHPLHVESVAWVAERKDVLSTCFFLLALGAYARYVEQPTRGQYLAIFLAMALGLLAKPMLVTLPFVLLLLDYWPLGRLRLGAGTGPARNHAALPLSRLVAEKVPLLGLALAASIATVLTQKQGEAVVSLEHVPVPLRLANAVLSYGAYLEKTLWPTRLAAFYPHATRDLVFWQVAVGAIVLILVSALVCWRVRRQPYLFVGWFWFVGTLVPVIGLVQVGQQALADRFAYIPNMGLYLIVAWGGAELLARWPAGKVILVPGVILVLAVCLLLTGRQVRRWRNSLTLWEHTLQVTGNDNYRVHTLLGNWFMHHDKDRRFARAVEHFQRARQLGVDDAELHEQLGGALMLTGRIDDAAPHFTRVLQFQPDNPDVHHDLGDIHLRRDRLEEARHHFAEVIRLNPPPMEGRSRLAEGHNKLGLVLGQQGDWPGAAMQHRQAVELSPHWAPYRRNLAHALQRQGQIPESEEQYRRASELNADWPQQAAVHAWSLATHPDAAQRQASEALRLATQACEATRYRDPQLLDVLAAAQAEAGQFPEATQTAEKALQLAEMAGLLDLAVALRERRGLYLNHEPYRERRGIPLPSSIDGPGASSNGREKSSER